MKTTRVTEEDDHARAAVGAVGVVVHEKGRGRRRRNGPGPGGGGGGAAAAAPDDDGVPTITYHPLSDEDESSDDEEMRALYRKYVPEMDNFLDD